MIPSLTWITLKHRNLFCCICVQFKAGVTWSISPFGGGGEGRAAITNSMERSSLWEANRHSTRWDIPWLLWKVNQRFITVFIRARHWPLSRARCIQSTVSHPVFIRYILILSSHLRLGLPSGLFPRGFPTKILYDVSSLPCYMPRLSHPSWI
jgi:hypothetical protein